MTRCRKRIMALMLMASILLSSITPGCNMRPKRPKPPVPTPPAYKELTPDQFKETDGWKTAQPGDDIIRGKWWEMFNDPLLSTLEEQINISNQNIAPAEATFRAARALVRQARSDLFPTITTSPSMTASRFPSNSNRITTPGTGSAGTTTTSGSTVTNYSLPFDVSWVPDLWGRVRNNVAANFYQAEASAADLENVRLTMRAELAANYYQLRGIDAQKQLSDSIVAAYQQSLELTRVLYQTGIVSEQDVSQAQTQLESARAANIDLGIQRAQFEHAIAVLVGEPASSFSIPVEALNARPPAIPFGIPSELLERRPDIAAAERRVAAANAQIGVARAAFFPTLNLSASGGFQNTVFGNLLNWPSRFWSVGPALAQTLFDGGFRAAVTEQARAVYDETVATYRQTVLTAFQGVEDNLAALRILSQERQQQEIAIQSAQRTLTLATERYRTGIDSYLNVITAQNTLYSNQQTAVTIRTEQMVTSVRLIMALGGGSRM